MTTRIQIRRGTTAQWADADPILAAGEFGLDTTARVVKIGDGDTVWSELAPFAGGAPDLSDVHWGGALGGQGQNPSLNTASVDNLVGGRIGAPGSASRAAVDAVVAAAVTVLKAGAPVAFDTLVEIADRLAEDDTALDGLLTALGDRLRKDQNLADLPDKAAARTALDVPSVEEVSATTGQQITEALGALAIPNSPDDIGAQPAGSYATTTALTAGLASKQDTGDFATHGDLTTGLAGKQPTGDYLVNPGGGTDGQALVRQGSGTAWATPAGGGSANGLSSNELVLAKIARSVESKFRQSQGIGLQRSGATLASATWYLYQKLSPAQFLRFGLAPRTNTFPNMTAPASPASPTPVHQVYDLVLVCPAVLVEDADAAMTYALAGGSAWTVSGVNRYSVTAGASVTYQTPAQTTAAGAQVGRFTNGGLFKVLINDDPTRAVLCPTAQDLVEQGIYPATILTVNGGTLAATDRVIDLYASGRSDNVLFADDLPPTTTGHKLALVVTGYARPAVAAGTGRGYFSGFFHRQAQNPGDAGTMLLTLKALDGGAGGSAFEYAISGKPPASGANTFVGSVHDYENQTSALTIQIDGATVTPADGVYTMPVSEIRIIRTTALYHPAMSGPWANVTLQYVLTRDGLVMDPSITVLQDFVMNAFYSMFPVCGPLGQAGGTLRALFDRGDLLENGAGPLRFLGTGGSENYLGSSKSAAAYMWESTGRLAVALWIENMAEFANNWAVSGTIRSAIQDRSGTITKAYLSRIGLGGGANVETFPTGKVITWRTHYLATTLASPERTFAGAL